MNVVYPLRRSSAGIEITYSIRSLEVFFDITEIFTIGFKPDLKVKHIPYPDNLNIKTLNSYFKIKHYCENNTGDFLLMNDDFFLLAPLKHYHREPLKEMAKTFSTYHKSAIRTEEVLKSRGLPFLNYEVHAPMIMNCEKFVKMDMPEKPGEHCLFRSFYGNHYPEPSTETKDFKAYKIEDIYKKDVLSITDNLAHHKEFQQYITRQFPNPSSYEN